jgi:putative DNA primase/helicase
MDATSTTGQVWCAQMTAEMNAAGMDAPATIIADGRLHRFAPDRARGDSGWYVVYVDEHFTSWAFGDWRSGVNHKGHTKPARRLSLKEWRAHKKRLREQRAQVQAERLAVQEAAAVEAQRRWQNLRSNPADPNHPYLKAKKVEPCGARQDGDRLVLAMTSIHDGKIWSWREIGPDGFKSNQRGGLQKGCFFRMGDFSNIFVICEGFATAATLTKMPWSRLPLFYTQRKERPTILAAGDAGNLEEIARGVRKRFRDAVIIIAADDDWLAKPRNTGLIRPEKAATVVGGILIKPWFPSSRPEWATDFNDQYKLCGIDQVYETFNLALIQHEEIKAVEREAAAAAFAPDDEEPEDLPRVEFPSADETVEFSEDALSLALANQHVDEWRHVQKWGWMHFRGGRFWMSLIGH